MVYMDHPDEFAPVSESAYCGAGVVHTMLLHMEATGNTDDAVQVATSAEQLTVFKGADSVWMLHIVLCLTGHRRCTLLG